MAKLVSYSSNNSGGSWWLSDENWKALEAAGWRVFWVSEHSHEKIGRPDKNGRWLGALATAAAVVRPTFRDALAEFENVAHQDAYAEGCSCCGSPHSFSVGDVPDDFDLSTLEGEHSSPEGVSMDYTSPAYDLTGSRPRYEPSF